MACPLVIDADGLNAFAGRAGELKSRRAETILTPHPGELGRLLGCSTARIQEVHILAIHCICDAVDLQLLGEQENT